jgi:hypothetical protein
VSRSWKYFVLKPDKTPFPNCAECAVADATHSREDCTCLTCHGFYAATDNPTIMRAMVDRYPDSRWAVRTGLASGIIVMDAEGGLQSQGVTGIQVLDDFENWTGGLALPTTGLIASTPSGGVHRYYRYVPGVKSKNRILPGVDIKSDGGYVLVPMQSETVRAGEHNVTLDRDREWFLDGEVGDLSEAVVDWLTQRRGMPGGGSVGSAGGGDHTDGYDFEKFAHNGCPGGVRDEFFNELIFRYRKAGLERGEVTVKVRDHWKRAAQPPNAEYYMPFHHVEYKIERIWRTVEPDRVPEGLREWAERMTAGGEKITGRRVTLVARGEE